MTNKNLSWNNQPLLLKPIGKDYLWGGNRLNDDFSKQIEMSPLAETWECSTHPDGLTTICGGEFDGMTLRDVLRKHPEYAGDTVLSDGELPILIKLIDAKEDLSVQVHPNDEYAAIHENGSLGKYEMWYVLDAKDHTRLVYGFNRDIDKERLKTCLAEGTLEKYLQSVPVQKDDIFYIKPGQVHALGAGALVAEIQENSNLTYRLHDYGRVDKDGNPRPLHIDKALDVMDTHSSATPRQPMRVLRYQKGCASEFLCRCKYFQVERLLINTERQREMTTFQSLEHTFQVLLCTEGCGVLLPENGKPMPIFKGDCIFVPAQSVPLILHGKMHFLNVTC